MRLKSRHLTLVFNSCFSANCKAKGVLNSDRNVTDNYHISKYKSVNVYVHKNTGGQIYVPQAEYEIQSNEMQSNKSAFNLRKS